MNYTATSGTLSWNDGDASVKVITVSIANDDLDEDMEQFYVTLENPTNSAVLGPTSTTMVNIVDSTKEASGTNGGSSSSGCFMNALKNQS